MYSHGGAAPAKRGRNLRRFQVVELTPPAGRDTTEKQGKSLVFWTVQLSFTLMAP
jgi:hypothetical protein